MKKLFKNSWKALLMAVFLVGCSSSSDSDGGDEATDQFDRQAMLTHWADNIIIPALEDLESDLSSLQAAKDAFVAAPDQAGLDNLRAAWLEAYQTWQYAEMFNIGRAESILYNFQMNVYPVNVADIQGNIASGSYDLSSVNNHDAVGFPALDFMLFGTGNSDSEILVQYTTAADAEGYRNYLSDLTNRMLELTSEVLSDWKSQYRDSFVSNTGNTATASVNKLTNDYIYYYERALRANKVGIPAGVFSLDPLPDRVEAYYNKEVSKALALVALDAVQDFFNGKSYGTGPVGTGFSAYLDYLRTLHGGEDISALINTQFNAARTQMETLDNNFASQIATDNSMMTKTYDELQKAVVLLKVDMVQAMNITIDYVDADGD
ncbi:imelysin family protein [Robertkochia flava]|uniref:imelysin family protein n=1 Tax=Robertkochia flava TaxID=3447986 RepID=UPI001CCC6E87|nr:imelysin family protein [Robertkochia marina]